MKALDLKAVDLCAGPGGWDHVARDLGIDVLGIENDLVTVKTRDAADLRTLVGDVSRLMPKHFGPIDLLIASPPCQAFSMAGKGEGRGDDIARVHDLTDHVKDGSPVFATSPPWRDSRSALVVEPLRWALALRPRFIALEQVPPVLDYWRHVADVLRVHGYGVWTGIMEAERYGVPQTRERAILMASLDGTPVPPVPTHQRYRRGEPARHEITLEGEVLPWVSMAQALGWPAGEAAEVGFPRRDDTGTSEDGYRERDWREADEPAFSVTEKARSAVKRTFVNNAQTRAAVRSEDEPAPTITAAHDVGERVWVDDLKGDDWPHRRPATTVAGDDGRVFQPGSHAANDGRTVRNGDGRSENVQKVSVEEAAVLQGFPREYPWRGSQTRQFLQIGNAVPPPLAKAILAALTERR